MSGFFGSVKGGVSCDRHRILTCISNFFKVVALGGGLVEVVVDKVNRFEATYEDI